MKTSVLVVQCVHPHLAGDPAREPWVHLAWAMAAPFGCQHLLRSYNVSTSGSKWLFGSRRQLVHLKIWKYSTRNTSNQCVMCAVFSPLVAKAVRGQCDHLAQAEAVYLVTGSGLSIHSGGRWLLRLVATLAGEVFISGEGWLCRGSVSTFRGLWLYPHPVCLERCVLGKTMATPGASCPPQWALAAPPKVW